jgi:hypothetical protein
MVVYACNPNTQEAEAGGSQVEVSLDYIARLCLKAKQNRAWSLAQVVERLPSMCKAVNAIPHTTERERDREREREREGRPPEQPSAQGASRSPRGSA